jgi:hypothetical protein
MRQILSCLLATALILVAGCDDRAQPPSVSGPLTQAPTPAAHVSAATETLITDHANAVATGNKMAVKATAVSIESQDTEQGIGDLRWLMLAGLVVAAVGIGAWAEFGKMIGGGILAAGAGLGVLSIVFAPLWAHRSAIAWAVIVAGFGYEIWRHRSVVKREGMALEHAIKSDFSGIEGWLKTSHPVAAVERVLVAAYDRVRSATETVALKLHILKAPAAPSPVAPPVAKT